MAKVMKPKATPMPKAPMSGKTMTKSKKGC